MCLGSINMHDITTLVAVRPRVTPDPAATRTLEEKRARVVPPEGGFLKDRVQKRIDDSIPTLVRRQAG